MDFSCNGNGVIMLIFRQVKFFKGLILYSRNLRDSKRQNFLKPRITTCCMLCNAAKGL